MKGIGVVPNWQKENAAAVTRQIESFFGSRNIPLFVAGPKETSIYTRPPLNETLANWADRVELIIVVGGDGTILRVARELYRWDVPILGINVGTKGFLAEIEVDAMDRYLRLLVEGEYHCSERILLQAALQRKGEILGTYTALNDIVISRGPLSRIIRLETYINNNFLESYCGDGMIVASPTGSTGYSLSAGGPIVNPSLDLLLINPICPHSLYSRTVITTGEEEIMMRNNSGIAQAVLTVDGQAGFVLEDRDEVVVRRADKKVKLVRFADSSFYCLLHQKLKS